MILLPSRSKPRTSFLEQGSVLLETVIVLPLYMILIGGIMWSGQLIYDKQRLVIADRYVAWNFGNRFAQNYNDVQSRFFSQVTPDSVNSIGARETASGPWWHEVIGSAQLNATMPVWTRGWFLTGTTETGGTLPVVVTLYGRDLADGYSGGHTVVMQKSSTPSDTRNAPVNPDDGLLGIDGNSIFYEDWPGQ